MELRSASSKVKVEAKSTPLKDLANAAAQDGISRELAILEPYKEDNDKMPKTQLEMQKQMGGKLAMSSVVDTASAYDPLLVQINTARLTHANTVSLMINNTAQVFSQRVSEAFVLALQQSNETSPLQLPLYALDEPIAEMTNLFNFGSIEAIGMMKGITDGVLRVLHQLLAQNPDVNFDLEHNKLEEKILKPWAMIIKRITNDLQKACVGFLRSPSLEKFLNVTEYNNGELIPWLEGDVAKMTRTADEKEMFDLNTERYHQDQQRAIDMHLVQLQYATQRTSYSQIMNQKRPFNQLQGFFAPEPKRKKSYSQRYYTAKNRQKNPNPKRICKSIWQDDGVNKGCGRNSHPKGVCACWKARGFEKKDLRNGRILAWLQMAYPGKNFDM